MTNYKVSTKTKTLSVEKVVPAHLLKQGFNWVVYEYSAKTGMLQNAYWLADYPDFKKVAPLLAHAKQNCLLNTHVCISGSTVSTAEVIATAQIERGEYVSQIPPTTTTDTKNDLYSNENDPLKSCVSDVSHDLQGLDQARSGVVDSVGEAHSCEFEQILSLCDTCLDLPSFMRCKDVCASLLTRSLSKDDPQISPVIDDDIPHFGLGV